MANVNVRNLPDEVHRAIRIQAAHHGRSTEAQALETLYLSVITVAELRAGIALPAWRSKRPMPSLQPSPSLTASPSP